MGKRIEQEKREVHERKDEITGKKTERGKIRENKRKENGKTKGAKK